jgi:ABC-type transport system involved in multi-copper enzyme maturation permease subunit
MMIRALQLEFLKLKHFKPFWIIIGLFTVFYFVLGIFTKRLIDWILEENLDELSQFKNIGIPIFDFVDIWQNLAYITFLFKWILAFVVIISICLEFSNKTIRQNIIDGLSRREFLFSKLLMILALSLFGGILLLLLGLFLGLLYSQVRSPDFVFMNMEFVPTYTLEIFSFLCLAMLFAFVIRRTGFAIIIFIFYTALFEPIGAAIMQFEYKIANWYLPVRAINNLIRVPFQKYAFREVQDFVSMTDVLVVFGWTAIFIFLSSWVLNSRNL